MKKEERIEHTISGIILPAEWDEDDNVISIGIETADEEDYIIYLDKMGKQLLSLVDHKVEATGTVKEVYGDLIFTVNRYSLLRQGDEEQ